MSVSRVPSILSASGSHRPQHIAAPLIPRDLTEPADCDDPPPDVMHFTQRDRKTHRSISLRRRHLHGRRNRSIAILAATVSILAGCSTTDEVKPGRVLIVGIDGANFRVIDRLTARNGVPNLQGLARQGVRGPLLAHFPIWSPRIWNSIATGKAPENHGILGFVHDRELYKSSDRTTHALWNIATDAGLRVGVVNWWNSYPPERINGVMISDHVLPGATHLRKLAHGATDDETLSPVVHPLEWQDRVLAMVEAEPKPVAFEDPFEERSDLPHWVKADKLSRAFVDDATITAMALEVEAQLRPDLLMVFLPGIDRVSHWLWGNLEPANAYPEHLRPTPTERRAGAEALFKYYMYTDALIGTLLERFGPDDLVLVVSDHGFEAGVVFKQLTGTHDSANAQQGILYARGPGIPAGRKARGAGDRLPSVDDITPSVLAWLGLPIGKDMDGQPLPDFERGPLTTVATHDTTTIERLDEKSSGAEPQMLEQLRELGYIE
ncbi:alkaline phosphatase family protein [Myxococcota bacterium]|nr:alkaline phosphatase family protein [Myxococcota bacterium]